MSSHGVIVTETFDHVHTGPAVTTVIRYAKIVGGFVVLAAGVLMIALPGPGWLTIALGLAILATEYVWARNLLDRLKKAGGKLRGSRPAHPDTPASPDRSPSPE